VLIVLAAVVLLPGLRSIPVVDRDEARFAQASRQMLESDSLDGWVIPMVGDRIRLSKPPLIYWAQASSAGLMTGFDSSADAIWMYRLPSVLAAMGTVLLVWRLGVMLFGGRTGLLAGAFVAVCPVIAFDAHMARSDELLLLLTTASMLMLYTCWRDGGQASDRLPLWRTSALWALVGLGMLAKGPITLMVVLLTAITMAGWTRRWSWLWRLRPISGTLVIGLVFLPWVLLAISAVGAQTLVEIAWDEVFVRSTSGRESHGAPPGYHLVLLVVLLWPGTLLTGVALARSWSRARRGGLAGAGLWARAVGILLHPAHGRGAEVFCLAWIVPSWIVFELAATKLPHYTLPLYPALALISARAVLAGTHALPQLRTLGPRLGFLLWFILGLGIVALPSALTWLAWTQGDLADPPPGSPVMSGFGAIQFTILALGSCFGLVLLVVALHRILTGRLLDGQLIAIPAAAVSLALSFGVVLPAAWPLWITPRIEHLLVEAGAFDGLQPIAAVDYQEDSLVHATRGHLQRIAPTNLTDWIAEHPGGWIILPESLAETTEHLQPIGAVAGFNYSKGEPVRLVVARVE